ncbi:DNA polymerase Y family protein [Fulvivirga ulvae]|uniref:Y-family DNA polymerase n=1 Tax=Fulvivirga ulvae TaxID=2904245 RepID=UPI001F320224|nr:DNA polymerase Y family protein [Fulvivirga ulvae]UII32195.1 DNA polymerase Y family protein [Fulvivirga ulvae]
MDKRYVSIWFKHLRTDWFALAQPELKDVPFVLRTPSHGRMVISALNEVASGKGLGIGTALADARAVVPDLEVADDKPELAGKLLHRLAEWCIRFTPSVAIDLPDGILMDVSGCTHLWGGEQAYLSDIISQLSARGYNVSVAMADTIGVVWGMARFGKGSLIVPTSEDIQALVKLPPEALRLEEEVVERLHKLGLHTIGQFIKMSSSSLRRRFGQHFVMRLQQALGHEMEMLQTVQPAEPYQERLPCLEPIVTATGIEIALQQLLEALCSRMQREQKGLRKGIVKAYRVDSKVEQVEIRTTRPSNHVGHLFKLFQAKISGIAPGLGIELFTLDAPRVEEHIPAQSKVWEGSGTFEDERLSELIDRLASKFSGKNIHRYLPDEHYWPERSFRPASSLNEKPGTIWCTDKQRPLHILATPEPIEVTAPIPDYPPMLFRYKGKLHEIVKADGPERIEQEWWIQQGQHRDYYQVEDETGHRYWLFRLGHYDDANFQWFVHGFFA